MFDIRRREFIALFGSAAVWPVSVHAQHSERVQRIGLLMSYLESDPEAQAWYAAFREGLQKLGWTEGRNIQIDTRWAAPDDAGSMQRFAKELVALDMKTGDLAGPGPASGTNSRTRSTPRRISDLPIEFRSSSH